MGFSSRHGVDLIWTYNIAEGRYWESESKARAQASLLRKNGNKISLVLAKVIEQKTGEEF